MSTDPADLIRDAIQATGPPAEGETPTAEQAPAEAPAAERLYADKYRTVEELEHSFLSNERERGRQADEIGQMRQELRALREAQEQQLAAQSVDWDTLDAGAVDPQYAAQAYTQAMQARPHEYERLLHEWAQVDPIGAARFDQQISLQNYLAPVQELVNRSALDQAWNTVRAEIPNLDSLAAPIGQAMQQYPVLAQLANTGTHEQRVEAFRALATVASARSGETLGAAAQQHAADQAAQARANGTVEGPAGLPGETAPEDVSTLIQNRILASQGLAPLP